MYFQKRGSSYTFIYYDTRRKKNVRLLQTKTPRDITTDEAAQKFCEAWDQKKGSTKQRLQKALEWKKDFSTWITRVELYQNVRKLEAPYSWKSDVFHLEAYILPFFLASHRADDLSKWESLLEDFRDSLLRTQCVHFRRALAYASRNNIISSLNTFLLMMYRRRKLERLCSCRYFESHLLRQKGVESLIGEEQQKAIFAALNSVEKTAALFFWVSLHTGLRLNELLGLSLGDLFRGQVNSPPLDTPLKAASLSYFGFIALESQPENQTNPRLEGLVPRKPLKGKKRIGHENSRVIPIFDRTAMGYLIELWNVQLKLYESRSHGQNPKNYLLFSRLNKSIYSRLLRQAQERLKFTYFFTPHDSRHNYSTWLANVTGGNFSVCQMILGHGEPATTLRYIHVNAQLHRGLKIEDQLQRPMSLEENDKNTSLPLDFENVRYLRRLRHSKP